MHYTSIFFLLHHVAVVSDETYIGGSYSQPEGSVISLRKKSSKLNFKNKYKQADN